MLRGEHPHQDDAMPEDQLHLVKYDEETDADDYGCHRAWTKKTSLEEEEEA